MDCILRLVFKKDFLQRRARFKKNNYHHLTTRKKGKESDIKETSRLYLNTESDMSLQSLIIGV